eukprot:TRINITY_DN79_c0_g1_i2.p2 TRINITY_DN79_c0_g1~~TRINITY_DN79_c0_g1_i2.p2  ORF type:complete len:142 (-),score=5.82 TRINITY_DN79_c0_g1_i2:274-699(-)
MGGGVAAVRLEEAQKEALEGALGLAGHVIVEAALSQLEIALPDSADVRGRARADDLCKRAIVSAPPLQCFLCYHCVSRRRVVHPPHDGFLEIAAEFRLEASDEVVLEKGKVSLSDLLSFMHLFAGQDADHGGLVAPESCLK